MTVRIDRTRIRAALYGFLEFLESTDRLANIELLELWLGQLAFIQHFIGELPEGDNEHSTRSNRDDAQWKILIETQFPALGVYTLPAAGNAVHDLADIAVEISECVQRWDDLGGDNALRHLRSGYQVRWGKQLRNLQAYIQNLPVKDRNKPARR